MKNNYDDRSLEAWTDFILGSRTGRDQQMYTLTIEFENGKAEREEFVQARNAILNGMARLKDIALERNLKISTPLLPDGKRTFITMVDRSGKLVPLAKAIITPGGRNMATPKKTAPKKKVAATTPTKKTPPVKKTTPPAPHKHPTAPAVKKIATAPKKAARKNKREVLGGILQNLPKKGRTIQEITDMVNGQCGGSAKNDLILVSQLGVFASFCGICIKDGDKLLPVE